MSVSGRISTFPLADLLQWIGLSRKTGRLELSSNRVSSSVFFDQGRVVACVSDDPTKLLGQFLVFRGAIDEGVLREVMAEQESSGRPIDEILVEAGHLSRARLDEHVAAKAEETLLGLFDWADATFRFDERVAPHPKAMRLDVSVDDLALRGVQRLDDAARIREAFGDPSAIPRRTGGDPRAALGLDWPAGQVLLAVDGSRSIRDIVLRVHGTEHQVAERLLTLHDAGLIAVEPAPAAPDPSAPAPPEPESPPAGEPPRSMQAYELALELIEASEFAAAIEILHAAFTDHPGEAMVRDLLKRAEEGLVAHMTAGDLALDKIPVLRGPRDGAAGASRSPEEEFILGLADGTWDIRSLTWVAPMRSVDVLCAVERLIRANLLELRDPG